MAVAVLSDIHGVLPALDAVLAEPDVQGCERIVLTGDIAAGPQPAQVLDRLTSLGERVVWVRGNCERELVDRRLVVNAGSVGMSYGSLGADWVLLDDGAVTVRSTRYDVEAARAAIRATCDYPDIDEWTDEYLNARNSDADALAVFGPGDGRAG